MRWRNLVLWVVAITLAVLLVGWATAEADGAARLRANGQRTVGTVTAVDDGLKSTAIFVSYETPAGLLHGRVYVAKASAGMKPGRSIVVFYDPKHPRRMTIEGEDNPSDLTVGVGIVLLLTAGCYLVGAVTSAWHMRVRTRVLRTQPWRLGELADVGPLTLHRIDATVGLLILAIPGERFSVQPCSTCWSWPFRRKWLRTGPVWICGDPGGSERIVLAKPDGTGLMLIKPSGAPFFARSSRSARRTTDIQS